MGTITCIILIGHEHPFHGGIQPTHILELSENDVPCWTLMKYPHTERAIGEGVVWELILDHPLEEALLMIALYVIKDNKVISLVKKIAKNDLFSKTCISPYRDIGEENLEEMFKILKEVDYKDIKLVITLLPESHILGKVDVVKNYNIKAEICLPRAIGMGVYHKAQPNHLERG